MFTLCPFNYVVLCFQHFQWMWLDELLWFQYMENTKVTPVKLLLCFPHFHLGMMKRYFCVFHISKYCIRGTFVFSIFSMLGIERTFVFSIYWKHKSWNRQKSIKVLLLRFVTFVTFVFYAHPQFSIVSHFSILSHFFSFVPLFNYVRAWQALGPGCRGRVSDSHCNIASWLFANVQWLRVSFF